MLIPVLCLEALVYVVNSFLSTYVSCNILIYLSLKVDRVLVTYQVLYVCESGISDATVWYKLA